MKLPVWLALVVLLLWVTEPAAAEATRRRFATPA